MVVDKNLENILINLSEDVRKRLKDRKDIFVKAIVIGKRENYDLFKKFFNKRTRYYYSKKLEYSPENKQIGKNIYPIFIDSFL